MHLFVRNISIDQNVREYCGGQGADNIVAYIGTHSRVYKISLKTRDLIFIIRPSGEASIDLVCFFSVSKVTVVSQSVV